MDKTTPANFPAKTKISPLPIALPSPVNPNNQNPPIVNNNLAGNHLKIPETPWKKKLKFAIDPQNHAPETTNPNKLTLIRRYSVIVKKLSA